MYGGLFPNSIYTYLTVKQKHQQNGASSNIFFSAKDNLTKLENVFHTSFFINQHSWSVGMSGKLVGNEESALVHKSKNIF